jgi:glycosyltransferase involved in cell wall biosynthesis
MTIIAVDASSTEKAQPTGVEEYSCQIIEGLKKYLEAGQKLVLYYQKKLPAFFAFHQENIEGKVLNWPFNRFWMQLRITWELLRRPPDLFFVPGQVLPFFISKKIKVATTIHDIGFARRPDLYPNSEIRRQTMATKRAVKRADIIFTPSEFTKKELMDIFHARSEQVVVTSLAVDREKYQLQSRELVMGVLNKYRLSYKNYLLFVGRIGCKKNPEVLIKAFETLKKNMGQGDPLCLVLAGPSDFRFAEIKKNIDQSLYKKFIFALGFVERTDLPQLMAGAKIFVSPSWYEGFNLPLLEAAACETPLIISDIPVNREVMDSAALFVPPDEPEKWATTLINAIHNPDQLSQLSKQGLYRVENFSWEQTAQQTAAAFSKIL